MARAPRGRTWKMRQLKFRREWPPADPDAVRADAADRRAQSLQLHQHWVETFADPMMVKAREVFIRQGRGAVCVSFADMRAALDGLDMKATIMPRDEVLGAVSQADPDKLGPIREMLDTYDPGDQFVLILFDDAGNLHPYRIRVEPASSTDEESVTFRLSAGDFIEHEDDDEDEPAIGFVDVEDAIDGVDAVDAGEADGSHDADDAGDAPDTVDPPPPR